jgi:hypothetical protein
MKKIDKRRLLMNKETILSLTPERLSQVRGGMIKESGGICNPSAATACPSCTDNSTTTGIA